jgi:hypothetical protein
MSIDESIIVMSSKDVDPMLLDALINTNINKNNNKNNINNNFHSVSLN